MEKVMIGLSGGVDSAVAAYILKKQGYHVIGGFMRNWDSLLNNDILGNPNNIEDICPQEQDYNDAKKVADDLGIELYRVDFVKEYWDHVFTYFLDEYQKGRTPNPDILCNKYIKFDAFFEFAKSKGATHIATGHYAKVVHDEKGSRMYKAKDSNKDQTYFLCQLSEEQLSTSLFPLGDINKEEVRRIAKELNLNVADKKDSTGVCFIGERDFKEFLKNYIPAQKGNIVDLESKQVIGEHDGVMYYTIGQRKGLGIGGLKEFSGKSWFVAKKDVKNNILYVAQGEDNEYLMADACIVSDVNWTYKDKPSEFFECQAKFRYRQKDNKAQVRFIDETTVEVKCLDKVKSITAGQAAVFYLDDLCLGGGVIDKVYRDSQLIG